LSVYEAVEQYGEFGLVILGDSGSGKSTSIKICSSSILYWKRKMSTDNRVAKLSINKIYKAFDGKRVWK
jgi:ABC-type lipoprotein export system ATPase subunit